MCGWWRPRTRNLEDLVESGKFRKDLFHRLAQFQLRVPPLRERVEDIVAIAQKVLQDRHPESRLAPDALAALRAYPWPGNVRELQNVLLQTMMGAVTAPLEVRAADLPTNIRLGAKTERRPVSGRNLAELEKRAILEAIASAGGNLNQAAEELGVSRRTLERKLKLYEEAQNSPHVLGVLSPEQQRYFRAGIQLPVVLRRTDGTEAEATVINISHSGIGLQLPEGFNDSGFDVAIDLPGCECRIEAKAQLAWSDGRGRCGASFTEMSAEGQRELGRWLSKRMQEEGWRIQP